MTDYTIDQVPALPPYRRQMVPGFDIRNGLRLLWRHKLLVSLAILAGLLTAQLIIWYIVPRYEAEAQIILDVRNTSVLKTDAVLSGLTPQPEVLRTELDVIASRSMAERVLDHMSPDDIRQLIDDGARATPMAEFLHAQYPRVVAFASRLLPWLVTTQSVASPAIGAPNLSDLQDREQLISLILGGLKVSNDGRSYTIHIGFASPHAALAARMANLYAEQYLANQMDQKSGATAKAAAWLNQRIQEMHGQVDTSGGAVDVFRKNTGVLGSNSGAVVSQQISDVTAQLAVARSQRLDAESQLRTVQSQLQGGGNLDALADVLSSQVIQSLRAKQADLAHQQALLNSQYTAKYPNTKSLQADIDALNAQIRAEINLAVKSLSNQVEIARGKEQQLAGNLAALEGQLGKGAEAEVKLQQLQKDADSTRSVYDTYVARLKEISEQEQLQAPDGYLISSATQPDMPTYPRITSVIMLGAIMGAVGGVVLACLRDMFDRRFRGVSQVEEVTGLPLVAIMPALSRFSLSRPEDKVLNSRGSEYDEALRMTWAAVILGKDQYARSSELVPINGGFHQTRRRRRVTATGTVVLVTSAVPNEGKTTFCVSMARSLAADGHRVLVVDGDLRRPGIAKSFGGTGVGRLTEVLHGEVELPEAIQIDARSGAHYLATENEDAHPQDILNSIRTEVVLDKARRIYDIILIDTPPILVAADAAIIAKFTDHNLFFIRWGSTSRERVSAALRRLMIYGVRMSGSVLSHVNMRRYAQYSAGDAYYRPYGNLAKPPRMERSFAGQVEING
jgi:succinoglycan biosynthesis transport protein ExoP